MLKKVTLIVLTALLLIFAIPSVVLASDAPDSLSKIILPGDPQETDPDMTDKPDIDTLFGDPESTEEMGDPDDGSVSSLALTSVGPSKYTKSLTKYNSSYKVHYLDITYTAPVTGGYTFYSLTDDDTDILIGNYNASAPFDGDTSTGPFALWAYLVAGQKYTIELLNWEGSSCSYLMTTPKTLDSSANTIKSNNYSYEWLQGFDFNISASGLYSLHLTCPSSCSYQYRIIQGTSYSNFSNFYYSGSLTSEDYSTQTYLTPGDYHMWVLMTNKSSKADTYTIALDGVSGTTGMSNGVTYTRTLASNDNFTFNNFIPVTTGNYKITCSRTEAKLTVKTSTGTVLATNGTPNRTISLTAGNNYYFYFTTPASTSPGSISYSATHLSPDSTLSGIATSAGASGTLSPAFNKNTTYYTLNVISENLTSVTITPQPTAPGGTFVINGTARSSINVPVTATTSQTVTIQYTAPDGSNSKTYTVLVKALSRACDVTSVNAPLTQDGRILSASVEASVESQLVNVSVSPGATWALYSNKACTSPIAGNTLSLPAGGLHRAYVKVTSESGKQSNIYPVLVYKLGDSAPAVVAYDSGYNEISGGAVLKTDVRVKVFGKSALSSAVTQNGSAFTWNGSALFTATGVYAITLTDGNSNTASLTFTIDKTAPVMTVKDTANTTIANGAWAKNAVKVTVADLTAVTKTAKKDGATIAWPAGDTFTADGSYSVEATDVMGNKSSYSFTIDRTIPAVLAKCGKTVLSNNAFVKSSVVVTVSDANYTGKSVTKNGAALKWPSSNKFSSAAAYAVTVTDKGGNATVFRFTIDNTTPKITAKAGKSTIKNKGKTKYDVTLTVTEANLATKTITMGGAAIAWPATNILSTEGYYVVTVTDKTGSKATLSFTIDKMPVVTVRTVSGAALANKARTGESVNITVTDKFLSSKSLKKNGKTIKWPSAGQVTADGVYTLYVKDKIGNKVTLTFTIDKSAPVITAKGKKSIANGGATKDSSVTVSIKDLISYTKSVTRNGASVSYPSKGKFTSEGVYVVTATDALGHKSTFTFIIDRSKPVITCKTAGTSRSITSGMTVNEDVIISVADRVSVTKTLTRNGSATAWPSNNIVNQNGVYVVNAKDSLGYASSAFTFTINKASPAITARDSSNAVIANGGSTKNNVTVTAAGAVQITATRNGAAYAYPSGGVFTAEGAYVVTARDSAGNTATLTFTIDKAGPVITAVNSDLAAVANGGLTNKNVTVTVNGASQTTATRNGAAYAYPSGGVFTAEGAYAVTARDSAGNTAAFTFTIDKTVPVVTAANSDLTAIVSGGFTNKNVTVTVTGSSLITANKNGASYAYPAGGLFTEEGEYAITASDAAGNSSAVFTFTIDKTGPVVTAADSDMAAVTTDDFTTKDVTVTVTGAQDIYVNKDGVGGSDFPAGGLFSEEARYVIEAVDSVGNWTTLIFSIDRTTPPGISAVLTSDMTTTVTDGSTVTSNVIMTIINSSDPYDFASVVIEKDDVVYKKYPLADGDDLSLLWDVEASQLIFENNGVYEITVTDMAGNEYTFIFTLAKV